MLSFPREGVTLAIDFAFKGETTLQLLNQLDEIVFAVNGALYPAKDARMSGGHFVRASHNWKRSFRSLILNSRRRSGDG
jgi:hypothetical protein